MYNGILFGVIIVALFFNFINGFHDTANAIATSVYTKALTAGKAILLAAVMNFIGTLVSEKVAMTISNGLINISLEQYVIMAALLGATCWNLITWWLGIPSSSSHALIGSLVGATMVYTSGTQNILWSGVVYKVVIPLFTSPLLGLVLGFLGMRLMYRMFVKWSQSHVNKVFLKMQIVSSAFVAFSHGNNDAQKTMGIMTLALISGGVLDPGSGVPMWVKIVCAVTMALGTSIGGWRIMKTMGGSVTKLEPSSGFVAQTASAIVIEGATLFGIPVSTTQVITTSIMGVGSAKRVSSVKWGIAQNIMIAWLLTLPVSIVFGGLFSWLIGAIV